MTGIDQVCSECMEVMVMEVNHAYCLKGIVYFLSVVWGARKNSLNHPRAILKKMSDGQIQITN